MSSQYQCKYCGATTLTSHGLHLHIMQTKRCRTRMEAETESSESANDCPVAATANDLSEDSDILMNEIDNNSPLDPNPVNDFLMDENNPPPGPNPINETEVVEDEEEYRWIETYPEPAGNTHGQDLSKFESLRKVQISEGSAPWFPFESEDEWELGRWLMTSGISQKKINSFLKLHKVSTSTHHFKELITYLS